MRAEANDASADHRRRSALNFLSINKERLLLAVTGPISTPETVRDEVVAKSHRDPRFRAVEKVWKKIPGRLLEVLPDDPTPESLENLNCPEFSGQSPIDRSNTNNQPGLVVDDELQTILQCVSCSQGQLVGNE